MNSLFTIKGFLATVLTAGLLTVSCSTTNPQVGGFYQPNQDIVDKKDTADVLSSNSKALQKTPALYQNQNYNQPQQSNAKANEIVDSFSGKASWYGPGFHGKKTASGEVFDENAYTAAHRSLPLGTNVRITNLKNGKSVLATINDRGPFVGDRVLDASKKVAMDLDYLDEGVTDVQVDILSSKADVAVDNKQRSNQLLPSSAAASKPKASQTTIASKPPNIEHVVQLGAFQSAQNAANFEKSLSVEFDNLTFQRMKGSNNLYLVFTGPFASHKLAEDIKNYLIDKGYRGFIKSMYNGRI